MTVALYEDTNSNGVLDGGDKLVGTTSTDSQRRTTASPACPNGTYLVDVTDDNNVLNGYWHSLGNQSQASDNTSKVDPYKVTLAGGQTITTADFGYYIEPAALGNFVWEDLNANGIQDAGEPGIAGVEVTLTIT